MHPFVSALEGWLWAACRVEYLVLIINLCVVLPSLDKQPSYRPFYDQLKVVLSGIAMHLTWRVYGISSFIMTRRGGEKEREGWLKCRLTALNQCWPTLGQTASQSVSQAINLLNKVFIFAINFISFLHE